MALAMERFSIREYTSDMRSIDVLKCWPFQETRKENIDAFLPPMTVRKFKWWADEAENQEETEEGGLSSCPVCLEFKTASVRAMNAHVDRCLAKSSSKEKIRMKAKSKQPKKRSIVEIFAVSPEVENVYEAEDEGEDDDEDEDGGDGVSSTQEDEFNDLKLSALIGVGLNDRRKRKMKSLAIVNKLKKQKKVKERDGVSIDISNPKKERSLKLKQKCPLTSTGNCNISSYTMELTSGLLDAVPVHKKKPWSKCFMTGKKKTFGTSKKQKSFLSVRGIMKKHPKVVSRKKSMLDTLRKSSEANFGARFSGKDDIPGRSSHAAEFPELENAFHSYSNAGAVSLEIDQFGAAKETRNDKSAPISKENENGVLSFTGKKSSEMCLCASKTNFLRPHISPEHLSNRPVTLNQVAHGSENLRRLEHGYRVSPHDHLSTCPPGSLSTENEVYRPNLITQGVENMSIANGDPRPRLPAVCYRDYVNPFPWSSSSYFTSDNVNGYGSQNLPYYPFRHLSPRELMLSICSVPDLEQRGAMPVERSMKKDFCRLPLNSQGELVHLNSSGTGGLNQLMGLPSTVTDSSRTIAQFFPVQDRVKENPHFLASSGFDITERQGTGRNGFSFLNYLTGSSQSVYPLEPGLGPIWNPSGDRNMHQERNSDLVSVNVSQPKMRLMGQEFSVGKNYRNLQENEKEVWMDKQIIAEHRPADTTTISSPLRKNFLPDFIMQPSSRKGKEIACSSEIQFNLASHMKPPESRNSQPYLTGQTNAVYENAPITRSYPCYPPEPFPYDYEPLPINARPIQASATHNTFQNLRPNYTQSGKNRRLPYPPTSSAFKFPFLHPELEVPVQPSCCQSSLITSLPPWMLNATHSKGTTISDPVGNRHPCTMSDNNFQKNPSICRTPDASDKYNPLFSQSPLQNASNLASTQSPVGRAGQKISKTSIMKNRREYRIKFKEQMKAKYCPNKDLSHGKGTKKRRAAKTDDSERPNKLPNLEISEDCRGRENNMEYGQNATQMDGSGVSEIDPLKVDGISRLGPIKLTAGAKHILKPIESMWKSNSRPTHLKVPFAAVTSSGMAYESQKSAKVYKF